MADSTPVILSIITFGVTITLTLFQYLMQSQLGWRVAKWLSLLLFVLSVCNVWEQNKDREFYIGSLEQIGARINWRDTNVSVDLLARPETISAQAVSIQMKFLSPDQVDLPATGSIDLGAIQRSCVGYQRDISALTFEQQW